MLQQDLRKRRTPQHPWAVLLALTLALPPTWAARSTPEPSKNQASTPELAARQADLGELRNRIETLRKELGSSEGSRAQAADKLRTSEQEISRLQRELHELSSQRGELQKRLQNLESQSGELGKTLEQQQAQLEKLLYRQYLRGAPDGLQLMLSGSNPNQMARDLHYLSAVALARAELMGEIAATLDRKKNLATAAKERNDELLAIEGEQQKRHADLQKQREERKVIYAQISDKVAAQRREMGNLQQNEQQLSNLIGRLSSIIAAQAAQAAKTAQATRNTEVARQRDKERDKPASEPERKARPPETTSITKPDTRPSETENHLDPEATSGSFARQKGNLRLPLKGTISGKFGSQREGGSTWRGLFIRAASGSEVKSIAAGRVVFAEWMRGFGNLLIVDHGDGYLSIYGNNDSLLKQVGQTVKGGETVATAGNSGGNPESGLYFELRHQGQPVDPMKWASLK